VLQKGSVFLFYNIEKRRKNSLKKGTAVNFSPSSLLLGGRSSPWSASFLLLFPLLPGGR